MLHSDSRGRHEIEHQTGHCQGLPVTVPPRVTIRKHRGYSVNLAWPLYRSPPDGAAGLAVRSIHCRAAAGALDIATRFPVLRIRTQGHTRARPEDHTRIRNPSPSFRSPCPVPAASCRAPFRNRARIRNQGHRPAGRIRNRVRRPVGRTRSPGPCRTRRPFRVPFGHLPGQKDQEPGIRRKPKSLCFFS
jgi:hypothetical protein